MASLEVQEHQQVSPTMDKEKIGSEEGAIETPTDTATEPVAEAKPAQMTFPEGGGRAWAVALGAAGILFCTFGYVNAFGVYQEFYQTHQLADQKPSTIAWIGSMQVFILFGGALVGGPLFDRFGSIIIWPAALAYVFSVMMTSLSSKFYQFLLAQGILGGFGMGMSMAPAIAATSQYFNKKRGAALGVAVAGSSLGGVIFPIALSRMLYNSSLGFGWSVRICGFIMLVVFIPSTYAIRARLPPRSEKFFLPQAFTEPQFLIIIGSVFLLLIGMFIPFFYLPEYAVSRGMDSELANYIISILNGASLFGRIIPGITADKFGRLNMLTGAALSTGILLFCMPKVTTNASIIVFSALYGFTSGAIVSLMSACIAQVPRSPKDIGTYLGMGMFVVSFAALIGPPINGALLDRYHGFTQISILGGITLLVGGLGIFCAKTTTERGLLGKV